jgi:hypothetical protein
MKIINIIKIEIFLIFVLLLTSCDLPDESEDPYNVQIDVPWVRAEDPQKDCAPAAVTMWAQYDRGIAVAATFSILGTEL